MKRNFLEFVNRKKYRNKILESFNAKNFDKVNDLIIDVLKKHTKVKIAKLPGYLDTFVDNQNLLTSVFLIDMGRIVMHINWYGTDFTEAYSIDFFIGPNHIFSGRGNSILTLYTEGSSIVYFLPIIWTLINSDNYNISQQDAIQAGRQVFDKNEEVKESVYYIGALQYKYINEAELSKSDLNTYKADLEKRRKAAYDRKEMSSEDMDLYNQLDNEYKNVIDAINGGATTIEDLKLRIKKNVPVTINDNQSIKDTEKEFNKEKEDPETTFKKMEHYLDMVIKGINPSIIICGAPGVGKTFRVTKKLKENGYVEGENLCTIKGKCTARKLYTELYNYREKGDIILIDDADSLIGKNADENSINILKGALDSTSAEEGKLITYGIAGKIQDDNGNDIPKRFYYNGSVIIITNWNAGNLDSALKGRSFIQDIHFTVEDALAIIKNIMPNIEPETLSTKAKMMAYDYLVELSKDNSENMEISIRTFGICAKIFETSLDPTDDFTYEDALAMIKEQMRLQAARRGEKY